jgi:hypothetical protein
MRLYQFGVTLLRNSKGFMLQESILAANWLRIGGPQSRESWSGHDFAVHEADAGVICRQFVTIVRIILRRPTD